MLEKVDGGYKVKKEHGSGYFSHRPQSKAKAQAQLRAIEASKHRHGYQEAMMAQEETAPAQYAASCGCEHARKSYRVSRAANGKYRVEYAGGGNAANESL